MAKRKSKTKVVSKKHIARRERERRQSALIRSIAIGIVVAVVLLIGYGYLDQTVFRAQRKVATVNGEKISLGQFQARVRLERDSLINQYIQYLQLGQSFGMDVTDQVQPIEQQLYQPVAIGQSVIDSMVYELLYKQEAQKMGITVSADEVETEIQTFLGYYADGTPTPEPEATIAPTREIPTLSPEQLKLVTVTPTPTAAPTSTPDPTATPAEEAKATATVEAEPTAVPIPTMTATPYTFEGYQKAYEEILPLYTEFGLSEEDFRSLFEARLYYDALYEKITADVSPEGEYIWARHILVADAATANVVREELLAGEDFSTLAQELSIDPSAATNSGDLGWFTRGAMVPEFEEAAFALENIGDISEMVQTDYGFHIIQLLGHEFRPLDATAYQNAKDKVFQDWIAAKREESDVEIFDEIWQANVPTDPDLQQTLAEYGQ